MMVINTIRDFCSNTTVHGFRYFTEANLSWIERLWWLLSIIVLIVLSTFATLNIWTNWQKSPVIVSFDDKTTSIGSIPFPAVTICSTQVIDNNKLNVQDLLNRFLSFKSGELDFNFTTDEISKLNALTQLCYGSSTGKLSHIPTIQFRSIYESITGITPDANVTIRFANFHQKNVHFQPIFTEHGLCYTFNSLNSRDIYSNEVVTELLSVYQNLGANWNIEDGYVKNVDRKKRFPGRVFGTKARDILTVRMGTLSKNFDSFCFDSANKFHFALHSPDELPRMAEDFMLIQSNQESRVTVSPVLIKTSDGLRGYIPEIRGCFFKSERKLRFFKVYSRNHCGLECLANYTKNTCDCMPFYLPRDNVTRVCTMFDYICYKKADDDFAESQAIDQCKCLPDCTSLTYNAISSQADLFNVGISGTNIESMKILFSKLSILYKQPTFIGLTRSETSTMADFIASLGGLLGLFMGVSILSVVELVYYFTLRPFFNIRRKKNSRIIQVAPASRIPRLMPAQNTTIQISNQLN